MSRVEPPIGLVAELSHRCPLSCPYCSNPTELERRAGELETASWRRVFEQAGKLGVMQLHLSGGEPTVRKDLEALVESARSAELYTNLITSGVLLDQARLERLAEAGLDHVQLSVQGATSATADRIADFDGAHQKKRALAAWVRELGLPLTLNAVVHRQNLEELPELIELALELDAARIEIAHTQYYGWARVNREALMPTYEQVEEAGRLVDKAKERLEGTLQIDYVAPDYYARFPKPCMGGWARRLMVISPSGKALPCHAAQSIEQLSFDNVEERSLEEIWHESSAFNRFRGTDWMPEPCQSCDRRELDWGGCRCQAFELTGDAANADPACERSEHHAMLAEMTESTSSQDPPAFVHRGFSSLREG